MRIVIDTNVLISGLFFYGLPSRILAEWAEGKFELVASIEVLAVYRLVAERLNKDFPSIDIKVLLQPPSDEVRVQVDVLPVTGLKWG